MFLCILLYTSLWDLDLKFSAILQTHFVYHKSVQHTLHLKPQIRAHPSSTVVHVVQPQIKRAISSVMYDALSFYHAHNMEHHSHAFSMMKLQPTYTYIHSFIHAPQQPSWQMHQAHHQDYVDVPPVLQMHHHPLFTGLPPGLVNRLQPIHFPYECTMTQLQASRWALTLSS